MRAAALRMQRLVPHVVAWCVPCADVAHEYIAFAIQKSNKLCDIRCLVMADNHFQLPAESAQLYQEAMLAPGRFDGDSQVAFDAWKDDFDACLRRESVPDPRLVYMFTDVVQHINTAHSRFVFFQVDTVQSEMLNAGAASGRRVFMRLQQGVSAMFRQPELPAVITQPVYAVDTFVLAFTAMYPKASRLPLVHLFAPDGTTRSLLTSGSDGYNIWPTVPDGYDNQFCALQLWGLLQFTVIPRHTVIGVQGDKCAEWGLHNGVAVATFFKQAELELAYDDRNLIVEIAA